MKWFVQKSVLQISKVSDDHHGGQVGWERRSGLAWENLEDRQDWVKVSRIWMLLTTQRTVTVFLLFAAGQSHVSFHVTRARSTSHQETWQNQPGEELQTPVTRGTNSSWLLWIFPSVRTQVPNPRDPANPRQTRMVSYPSC